MIALTERGHAVSAEMTAVFTEPPPLMRILSPAERRELGRLLAKITPSNDTPLHPFGTHRPR